MDIEFPPKYSNSKFPLFPPTTTPERAQSIVRASTTTDEQGRYWHWDKLRKLEPPQDWSVEEWWAGMKWVRNRKGRQLPFIATTGSPFSLVTPACVLVQLNWLDQNMGCKGLYAPCLLGGEERSALVMEALRQEAAGSRVLEGAEFNHRHDGTLLQVGQELQDDDEWMLQSYCKAFEYIRKNQAEELTPERLLELHRILAAHPLVDPSAVGRFRIGEDNAGFLEKDKGILWYEPPAVQEVEERVFRICSFANSASGMGDSIHPIIVSILLHLMFLYDRPFAVANGQMARILFYRHMLKSGYELAELLSISRVLATAPGQYGRSFRYVVSDENDATYFVIHQLDIIIKAFQNLRGHLEREG